ncbi:MAG: capsule assembly Wzi family protein [Paraprevotella sp.]|nr:capsule assembly Wzi family protein [Paraprevotella sp.]
MKRRDENSGRVMSIQDRHFCRKAASKALLCVLAVFAQQGRAQEVDTTLTYRVEASTDISSGNYAPLWFTANRNGLSSQKPNSAYLRAGLTYRHSFRHSWHIGAGLDLAAAVNSPSEFIVQQAYADFSWRMLNLSVGSKERGPLGKNPLLSSGGMVEGNNARPVPQVRAEVAEYYTVPGTKEWFAFKGYIAFGRFTDDRWQRDFARSHLQPYVEDVLYHSKELMFKVGNREKFPLEGEVGLLMSAQFGGKRHTFDSHGNESVYAMPHDLKSYVKVFLAQAGGSNTTAGDQVNVEGNHLGSWNFYMNYYLGDWKFRAYYEHFFDDHSQMFLQYGRWKDGHLGIEVTLPENRWVNTLLWEGLATKDQSGPILYDGDERFQGRGYVAFPGMQISARDDYYNNFFYQSWEHYGLGLGNPLLPGPLYNKDGSLMFRSNRVRANHWAFSGTPTDEWGYRVLMSYALHWGRYADPLDKICRQFSSLYEVTYSPKALSGWHFSLSAAVDHGDFLGNSTGGMITIRKEGIWIR